jgi:ABC-type lipoprotein release transport system permease subunit
MIFVFTSIAVLNTLIMIALRRRRELALLALVALSVPTRRALRTQPVEAIGIRE